MPSFVPRNEPIKKKEQLEIKKHVLENAIIHKLEQSVIEKKAENYKMARVLFYKTILHLIRDNELKKKKNNHDKKKTIEELELWEQKSIYEIINEIAIELKSDDNISTQ